LFINALFARIGLTLLFTQSQPGWLGAVFLKGHGTIFDLSAEPVNFIFKGLRRFWAGCQIAAQITFDLP